MTTSTAEGWVPAPEPPPSDTFGTRLRRIRRHLNLSTEDIAPMCGISPATWRSWEALGSHPRRMTDVVRRITEATGASRDWLMWGDPPDSPGDEKPALSVMSSRDLALVS